MNSIESFEKPEPYRILIVDDILVNRLLIKEIIKKTGALCVEAPDGKSAIDILLTQPINLIFMDIEMPVMNGLEATRFIRKEAPPSKRDVPIVALTAHNPYSFFEDFRDVGFDKLLTKPYSINKVLSIIEEVGKKGEWQ